MSVTAAITRLSQEFRAAGLRQPAEIVLKDSAALRRFEDVCASELGIALRPAVLPPNGRTVTTISDIVIRSR